MGACCVAGAMHGRLPMTLVRMPYMMYGTRLAGGVGGRTAVIIQPAPHSEIIPIIALAYGLTARERKISQLCLRGLVTSIRGTSRLERVPPRTAGSGG
jgi:hypothetical protein